MTIRPHKIVLALLGLFASVSIIYFGYVCIYNPTPIDELGELRKAIAFIGGTIVVVGLPVWLGYVLQERPEWKVKTPKWAKHKKKDPVLLAKLEEVHNEIRLAKEGDLARLIRDKELLEEKLGV